jgi:hypothetical protein
MAHLILPLRAWIRNLQRLYLPVWPTGLDAFEKEQWSSVMESSYGEVAKNKVYITQMEACTTCYDMMISTGTGWQKGVGFVMHFRLRCWDPR